MFHEIQTQVQAVKVLIPTRLNKPELHSSIGSTESWERYMQQWPKYKVVQIWPGQTVTCLHTNSPGHIWTTLYNKPSV
jgi:hypothetical protein